MADMTIALISSLLSMTTKLLPEVKNSFFAPSSSSSAQAPNTSDVEADLNALLRMLESIKKALCDIEERGFRDQLAKRWLKELKEVGYAAEDAIDAYMYEVYRAKVEARNAFKLNSHKRKLGERSVASSCAHSIRIPDGIADCIRKLTSKLDEIEMNRKTLCLHKEDGARRDENVRFREPTSHLFDKSNVFGREMDKEEIIDILLSRNKGNTKIVAIVGKGGIGKTTLAQFIFDDKRVKNNCNLLGWACVSEDLVVERLLQNLIESFTKEDCLLNDCSDLNEEIKNIVKGKRVLIVLDDVWNEDEKLWELFYVPFMSALSVAFVVTTRSDAVASNMRATSIFRIGCLSEEESWSLFQHYAFFGSDSKDPNKLNIGRQITKKCGGLPLALKSISNLLRLDQGGKSWINILQNDLWDGNDDDKTYRVLQISYTHMPAYLRPCFLYCSLFPKNYEYDMDEVIELWITQGYIEFNRDRSFEEIAFACVHELRERSFFDFSGKSYFKIHDIIHDLARRNSGYEFYSAERGKLPNPNNGVLHFYMDAGYEYAAISNHLTPDSVANLRTLVIQYPSNSIDISDAKSLRTIKLYRNFKRWGEGLSLNFVFPKHLRFLEINCRFKGPLSESVFSLYHLEKLNLNLEKNQMELEALRNLINLQYLSLSKCNVQNLLESLCLLKKLRTLSVSYCESVGLPENVGDLVHLEKLVFRTCAISETLNMLPESLCNLPNLKSLSLISCQGLRELPKDFGNLTNLQSLIIKDSRISYLSDSANLLNTCHQFDVGICPDKKGLYKTIAWLKGFDNLKGTLVILQLDGLPISENGENYFNLLSKPKIKKLLLSWEEYFPSAVDKNNKRLEIKTNLCSVRVIEGKHLRLLESLQPHPNLKHLGISEYKNDAFPRWMGDRLACASLKTLHIISCDIHHLHFANLPSLNHLKIDNCNNLETISHLSLPLCLRSLIISSCSWLLSITGLHNVDSLVLVKVDSCKRLESFSFELISRKHCYKPSSSELKNLSPAKIVKIGSCPSLTENKVVSSAEGQIEIYNCLNLKEWCSRHNFSYTTMNPACLMLAFRYKATGNKARRSDLHLFSDSSDEEEDVSTDSEFVNLRDSNQNKIYSGKQTMEMDEVGNSFSQDIHIPAGQDNMKHMEQGSSSADVMDEDHTEKENSSTDVMDED